MTESVRPRRLGGEHLVDGDLLGPGSSAEPDGLVEDLAMVRVTASVRPVESVGLAQVVGAGDEEPAVACRWSPGRVRRCGLRPID